MYLFSHLHSSCAIFIFQTSPSHYALIKLAKFYNVTVDYLLGLSEIKHRPNAELEDLHLNDEMIDLLKSERLDNTLFCELVVHPDFTRLMADLEIYANGVAVQQVQKANILLKQAEVKLMEADTSDENRQKLRQIIAAHLDEERYCRHVIQQDIDGIALALREKHKNDFSSVPIDNPEEQIIEFMKEVSDPETDAEKRALLQICKMLHIPYKKLTEEEKKWFRQIAAKSNLMKNPIPQRRKKQKR